MSIVKHWVRYLRSTKAIAAMEYAVIVGVIVVGISAAALTFSNNIGNFMTRMAGKLAGIAT